MQKWTVKTNSDDAVVKRAIEFVSNEVFSSCGYVPQDSDGDRVMEFIVDGSVAKQGYDLTVTNDRVTIKGGDGNGVLYGAVDFIGEYINGVLTASEDIFLENAFESVFDKPFPSFSKKSVPSIKERGIWSWGHCVYDYKKFFENMAKLKLNMAVIWNDEVPTNALEVINYAHSFGIKVYFGYAWGWDNKQNQSDYLTKEAIAKLKESCVKKYEETHLPLGLDGIYFQSFTETTNEYMGDKTIAEVVTGLVNEISGELLRRYPDLKIQFGLHALSTKNHLDKIAKTDERVEIIWEDLGAFPYDYRPDAIDGYEQTIALQERASVLRGKDDKFGVVYKGMTKLDWTRFVHQDDSAIGVRDSEFILQRQKKKASLWKFLRAKWLKNFDYFHNAVKSIVKMKGANATIQMLVEDGVLETGADLTIKIASQTLWNSFESREAIFDKAVLLPE